MSEQSTLAASSPAQEADVFGGQQPTFDEFSSYRKTGELPARFKPAEAITDAPEETVEAPAVEETETDSESDPEEDAQEPTTAPTEAQKRIKELLAKVKELERKQQPAPKPAEPQQVAAPVVDRAKPAPEGNGPDGKPYATYEAYIEDLADWKAEQHIKGFEAKQANQAAQQKVAAVVEEARERYGDAFDKIIEPTAGEVLGDNSIPFEVKRMLATSDVASDLVFVIGSDPKVKEQFKKAARTDQLTALRYLATLEAGIRQEQEAGQKTQSGTAPEKKPTQAPKPPQPVSGVTTRGFDVSDESLSADDWMKKRQAQIDKRKKG